MALTRPVKHGGPAQRDLTIGRIDLKGLVETGDGLVETAQVVAVPGSLAPVLRVSGPPLRRSLPDRCRLFSTAGLHEHLSPHLPGTLISRIELAGLRHAAQRVFHVAEEGQA